MAEAQLIGRGARYFPFMAPEQPDAARENASTIAMWNILCASCWGCLATTLTCPATERTEKGVLDFARSKRFFYVGFYVGHGPQGFVLFNYINQRWRRRWDSNPRDPSGPTPLAGERLRPLGHISAAGYSRASIGYTRVNWPFIETCRDGPQALEMAWKDTERNSFWARHGHRPWSYAECWVVIKSS